MAELKRILVGIDPHQSRYGRFSPPTAEAAKQAIWLAERMSAEIMFMSVLDPLHDDELYTLFGETRRKAAEIGAGHQGPLDTLVDQAQQHGVRAASKIAYGTGWAELTREAIDGRYDLVVVGTRNRGWFHRTLFGSTATELLENCPAPVWVTKPEPYMMPSKILVASDFSSVSDKALRLAVSIGSSCLADMHLIHVVKEPFAHLCDTGEPEARTEESYHEQDLAVAKQHLNEQLTRVLADTGPAGIAIAEDTAVVDYSIAKYAEHQQIDLLVMGTSVRQSLAGVFAGNTAERLLHTVNCSLVVVKPDGFTCPVDLKSHHGEPAVSQ